MNSLTKKALAFALAIAAVAAIGWFGRKTYKTATEHRLLAEAHRCLDDKDARNAALCLQRALQVNPMSLEAARMTADMLDGAGMPAALSWRIRAAQLRPAEMQYRFDWARTAFRLQDIRSAAEALAGVDESGKTTAAYYKLAGELAWSLNKPAEAEKQYTDALRLESHNQLIVLNLATIHLASTNSAVADAARLSISQMAASTNSELRVRSLQLLATDAAAHKSFSRAVGYSKRLVQDPSATFKDKVGHLQLLKDAGSDEFGRWLASLEQEAKASPASAFLLGEWMATRENPASALRWLQSLPATVQTTQPVPLIVADCHIALKDWPGLLKLIGTADWGEMNYYRLALESAAHRSLGHDAAALTAWQKALRLSTHRLDRLSRLARLTAVFRWSKERAEILDEITSTFPTEKWAIDQLVAQLYAQGDTRAIQELLTRIQAANPSDPQLKNNLAIILLLRNSELEKAHRMAKESYDDAPGDPFFASTYAYSLLLQKNQNEAVKVFSGVKSKYLQIPSVAAYYGVVQAEAGHPDIAKAALARAEAAQLLPEEREMIRLAKTRL
jgi:hypothetical protein